MTEHIEVGTAEMLISRIYPLDGEAAKFGHGRSVVVAPGRYPVYRYDDAVYVLYRGRLNARDWHKIGDGLFIAGGGDQGEGPEITFPSRVWSLDEFADLRSDPELASRVRYEVELES